MMKTFLTLLSFSIAVTTVPPVAHAGLLLARKAPHKVEPLSRRQDTSNPQVVTTGVMNNGSGVQPRLELRELAQDADSWNLYLLGLRRFMDADENDQLSYYQIMGIHGMPMKDWNGVPGDPNGYWGYCMHASNVFLPWHRPYVALYEQLVQAKVAEVARDYPDSTRARMQNLASEFRVPYWDWAMHPPENDSIYPVAMSVQTAQVTLPNGTETTIPNPLFSYSFHPMIHDDLYFSDDYKQFVEWLSTRRQPHGFDANAQTDNSAVLGAFHDGLPDGGRVRLYALLTRYQNYMDFSNAAYKDSINDPAHQDSLEAVHNQVHAAIGGNGHMGLPPWGGFDPSFMLHHAMVDRLFAMWQALYPDSYVEPQKQSQTSYAVPAGANQDVNSPLYPFRSDTNGGFWTSASSRVPQEFGYTYTDLQGDNTTLINRINQLYGASTLGTFQKRDGNPAAPHRDYIANVRSDKLAFDGTYIVFFFLGNASSDPQSWSKDPDLVGTHSVWAPPATPGQKKEVIVSGSVPLTEGLQKKVQNGQLESMDEDTVVAYMKSNFNWKVKTVKGDVVPAQNVPALVVSVASSEVQPASGPGQFPQWVGPVTVHDDITATKAGGKTSGDSA